MSMFNNTSRFNCLGSAAFFAALALMATAAFGDVVNHGNFVTDQVSFRDVTESGDDVPPGWFAPPTPTVGSSGSTNEISFFPNRFIVTGTDQSFGFASLSSQLGMFAAGRIVSGTAGPIGYELKSLNMSITGAYDLFAPFVNVPPSNTTSIAAVQMNNVPLSIKVTQVNWDPKGYAGGKPLTADMVVVPSSDTVSGPLGAKSGTWTGSYAVNWNDLRVAAGLQPGDYITEIQIQATATVHAASMFASAKASVTNFDIQTETAPVAVPEPPTVILA
ncbi:MAG: hypothetical protein ACKOBP_11385, partial [Planctomycetia bacterium]